MVERTANGHAIECGAAPHMSERQARAYLLRLAADIEAATPDGVGWCVQVDAWYRHAPTAPIGRVIITDAEPHEAARARAIIAAVV